MLAVYIFGPIMVIGLIVTIIVAIVNSIEDKKVLRLMLTKGTLLELSKENYEKHKAVMAQLFVPVRIYLNGTDRNFWKGEWMSHERHFILSPDGSLLFDVWVGFGSRSATRSSSKLYVVEFKDNEITHFVLGKEYIKNGGSFDGLSNAVFI